MSEQVVETMQTEQADRVSLPASAPAVRVTAGIGSASQKTWNLRRPAALVGSRRTALMHLDSPEVSKAHCLIVNTGSDVLLRDLASRTGTFCDEHQVCLEPLRDGSVIRVGSWAIQVAIQRVAEGNDDTETGYQYLDPTKMPQPLALVDRQGQRHEVTCSVAVIGRRDSCDVVVTQESASLAHAVIFHVQQRPVVYDLGSRTGTFLNDRPVRLAYMADGDKIRLGDVEYTVHAPHSPALSQEQPQAAPEAAPEPVEQASTTPPEPSPEAASQEPQADAPPPDDQQAPEQADTSPEAEPLDTAEPTEETLGQVDDGQSILDPSHPVEVFAELQSKVVALQENVLTWWDRLNDWQTHLEQQNRQVQQQASELKERDDTLAAREEAIQAQQQQLQATQSDLEKLGRQIESGQAELEKTTAQLDQARSELHAQREQVQQQTNQLQTHHQELTERSRQLEQREASLARRQKQIEQQAAGLQQRQQAISTHQAALGQLQAALDQANRAFQESLGRRMAAISAVTNAPGQPDQPSHAASQATPAGKPATGDSARKTKHAAHDHAPQPHEEGTEQNVAAHPSPPAEADAQAAAHQPSDAPEAPAPQQQPAEQTDSHPEPQPRHAGGSISVSMDLDPETADKLRMLRRLTNGQKSDQDLLAQIRAEQQGQELSVHDRKKRWRWLGS